MTPLRIAKFGGTSVADFHTYTALVTPFHEDGSIDPETLLELMKLQEAAGNGILLLGSTGEGISLTNDERIALLDHCLQRSWKVPILAGVGGAQLEEQCRWLDQCKKYPLSGYLLTTPIYLRPGPYGQTHWFCTLLDRAGRPCILYNIPHRAGCQLSTEAVAALHTHPNFWAIKEGSGDIEQFRALRKAALEIPVFVGSDTSLQALMQEGAAGIIAVMGNAWPSSTHQLVSELLAGKTSPGPWEAASRAANINNPVSIKILLSMQGKIKAPILRPPLSTDDVSHREELRRCDAAVRRWCA